MVFFLVQFFTFVFFFVFLSVIEILLNYILYSFYILLNLEILSYADGIDAVRRTTLSVSCVSWAEKEVKPRGLRVNADKTKCMLSSRIIGPNFYHWKL